MDSYRYGFQNQEKDDELKGAGNSMNFEYRMFDARVGRFFAVDPLASKFPWNSVYAFSENRVLDAIELEGLEVGKLNIDFGNKTGVLTFSKVYKVITEGQNAVHNLEFYTSDEYKKGLKDATSNQNIIYITDIKRDENGDLIKFKLCSEDDYNKGNGDVFAISVIFDIKVIVEEGFTMAKGKDFIEENTMLNGVIFAPDPNDPNTLFNFNDTDMEAYGKSYIASNEELLNSNSKYYTENYGKNEDVSKEYRKGKVTAHEAFHNFGLKHKGDDYNQKGIMAKRVENIEINSNNTENVVKKNIKKIKNE